MNYELEITPKPSVLNENIDFFGNSVTHFSIDKQHKELIVTAKSNVERSYEIQEKNEHLKGDKNITLEKAIEKLSSFSNEIIDAKQFLLDSPFINKISTSIKEYTEVSFKKERSVFEASKELMKRIFTDFKFDATFSTIATPIDEVMKEKKGTDASHAWFSVFIPDFGWVDFDPTNNQIPKNQHITVAFGRDYYDVPPLKGVIYGSGNSIMKVSVDIRPAKD